MNFKEVLLESTTNRKVPQNRIAVVHGSTHWCVTLNSEVSKLIDKSGFTKVKVYEDISSKTISFVFSNVGMTIQPLTEKIRTIRIQQKTLVEYLVKFFDLPPMNKRDLLFISGNKSKTSEYLTFYIRKDSSFELEL